MTVCAYCHREIEKVGSGHWAHVYRTAGTEEVSHLNRCQSPDVPYGQDATPEKEKEQQ